MSISNFQQILLFGNNFSQNKCLAISFSLKQINYKGLQFSIGDILKQAYACRKILQTVIKLIST